MYIERDAKIILAYGSVIGIIWFVVFYIILLQNQQIHPIDNFSTLQLMIFGILFILTALLIGSLISLKREITTQQEYLKNLPEAAVPKDKYAQIPYNKAGLYSIIIASVLGIFAFLYLYSYFFLEPQTRPNMFLGTVSTMILFFLIIFIIILLATLFALMKRIHTPLYYTYKACPRCGSDDIFRVEYSWWGGLIGPNLVHQVRCKKCGKTYDGATGTNIAKRMSIYVVIMIVIFTILIILRLIV